MKKLIFVIVAILAAGTAGAQSQFIKANRVEIIKSESTVPLSDSTFTLRSSINQTIGSSTNRLYNGKFYTIYSGLENQFVVGGISSYISNYGTGTVTSVGGLPVSIYTGTGATTTNIYGYPVNIYNRGKVNKMIGGGSWLYNYNTDAANNDAYGWYTQFNNYGVLDGLSGFQADLYNTGTISNIQGLLIGLHHDGGTMTNMVGLNIGYNFDSGHNWTGNPTNSYGIVIDKSIDRGSSLRYSILSESRSLSRLYGKLQLDTLRGTGNRFAMVDANGLFSATKKDSVTYWNLAYSWGNHAAQGYITDGNTGWDNLYGFITDGNTGWDNSYGFITDGNTGWDNSYGFITDGNSGWDNSYGFITKRPPISANYLVGTASDSLSNEIVVGTTPGGILGNTWASPTLDNYSVTQTMLDTYIEGTPDAGMFLGYGAYGMDWLGLPTANASGTKGIATFNANDFNSTDGEISIDYANATKATAMVNGFLSSTDWGIFNAKIGGSGAAGAVAIFDAINTITNDADFTFNSSTNALTVGSGSGNGSVTSGNFILSSDLRLKANIKPLAKHEWADAIEFKSFTMKSDKTGRKRYGVIAQELEKINPELVYTNAKGYKSVAYIDLLVAKVARQDEIIRNLIERINKLEDANEKK